MNAQKLFIVMITILALAIGGSGFLYLQTKTQLQSSIDAIAGKKAEIEQSEQNVQKLEALRQEITNYENENVNLSVFLPTAKNQSEALDILLDTFNDVGINVTSFTFTPTEGVPNSTSQSDKDSATNVYDLPITIAPNSANSIPYPTFMQLLTELENSQRHLSIDSLSITSANAEDGNEGDVNIGLSVSMHYVE